MVIANVYMLGIDSMPVVVINYDLEHGHSGTADYNNYFVANFKDHDGGMEIYISNYNCSCVKRDYYNSRKVCRHVAYYDVI